MGCDNSAEDFDQQRIEGTLHYFNGYGRGEQIRILLWKANKNYNDHRIDFDEWAELKPDFPN